MARVYLAAMYSRRLELVAVARLLTVAGHEITSRWIRGGHDCEHEEPDTQAAFALEDLEDLERADVVVSFTEEPGSGRRARGGRHVEFGFGLHAGKTMIVVGPRENVFHHVPGVLVVDSVDQVVRILASQERRAS